MAIRFYLIPKAGNGSRTNPYRPMYFDGMRLHMEAVEFGDEPTMLAAADVSGAQHTSLAGNADVTSVPTDLDSQVGANLGTVQAALETVNLPGTWVQAAHTYRQLLHGVWAVMKIAQRLWTLHAVRWFDTGITLNTTIGDLTVNQRARLQSVADSLGLDYSSVTLATTMRQVLRGLAQQLPARELMGQPFQEIP